MIILDAQVHTWYSDRPSRPWAREYRETNRDKRSYLQHAGQTNSPDMVLAEMAEAGVDGALLTALGIYGTSIDLELETAERDPDRFQVIGVVDHLAVDVAGSLAEAKTRGLRGIRTLAMRDPARVSRREFDPLLQACSDLHLVVMLPMTHPLNPRLPDLFRRYPDVFFYFNHLATGFAPPIVGFRPEDPFQHLAAVLELAEVRNVGLKLTGAPALSAESYPFRDIWPAIVQLVDVFGADRISWGSDYTRTAGLYSYWESTHYLAEIPGFSDEQRALLYGEALALRTGWRPRVHDRHGEHL
jgi:L-fuconolactonase